MKRIFYSPFGNDINFYCKRMQRLLSKIGCVSEIDKKKIIFDFLFFRRNDVLILNWFENRIVNAYGLLSYWNVFKVCVYFIFFRLMFKNFIFIRHNNYPHNCIKKNTSEAVKIINFLEKIPHKVVVHSPVETENNKRIYVAHPLYNNKIEEKPINTGSNNFVIFGRILRYKKIENVLKIFPDGLSLTIVGKCEDDSYLQELKEVVGERENIKIISEFISDNQATDIIANSQGLLITHNDDDMIVSGSFFYAMTIGSKVYCLSTKFFEWVHMEMGSAYIESYLTLEEMFLALESKDDSKEMTYLLRKNPQDLFGDDVVLEQLKNII